MCVCFEINVCVCTLSCMNSHKICHKSHINIVDETIPKSRKFNCSCRVKSKSPSAAIQDLKDKLLLFVPFQ